MPAPLCATTIVFPFTIQPHVISVKTILHAILSEEPHHTPTLNHFDFTTIHNDWT